MSLPEATVSDPLCQLTIEFAWVYGVLCGMFLALWLRTRRG